MSTTIIDTKHAYKIKVDDLMLEFEKPVVIGSEILIKARRTPVECFSLYQKLQGCDFEKISLDEKVDLSKPGIENSPLRNRCISLYSRWRTRTTDRKELTAYEILVLAGLNPKIIFGSNKS